MNIKNTRSFHEIVLSSCYQTSCYHKDGHFAGDIGGICGVFIGFSFISIVEFLYFLALMFRDLLRKKLTLQEDDDSKDEIPSVQTPAKQIIYWNELQPRSWHSAKYGKFSNRARY